MSQTWQQIEGTIYGYPELSKKNRVIAHKMTMLMDAVTRATEFNIGKQSGDKVGYRLTGRLSSTAHTPLPETQKVPFTKPTQYTGTAQVNRYAQAIPWTGTRKDLDRLDIEEVNIRVLRDNISRTLNKLIYDVLVAGRSFTYVALTSSTYAWLADGTVAGTAAASYSLFHARKLKLKATQLNIPKADGQGWWFYGSPIIEDNLMGDTATNGFIDVAKYAPSRADGLLNGEIGRVSQIRHVIDNDVIADGIGTGSAYGSGFLLGDEAVKEVMVYPPEFRVNLNLGGDFGNQQAIAWQTILAYKAIWNYTAHGQGSIVHYTSA